MNSRLLERLSEITDEERRMLGGKKLDMSNYSFNSNSVVESSKLLKAGKLFTIRPNTRFTAFPEHSHNYIEIIYMCSGHQRHTVNRSCEIDLRAGELLLLNRGTRHSTEIAAENDIAVNFIVLPQFFGTAVEMIGTDNIISRFLFEQLNGKKHKIDYMLFKVADVVPVQNLLENLIWSVIYGQPNRRNINQVTMGLLFLQLLGLTDRMSTSREEGSSESIVMQALAEIEQNFQTARLGTVSEKYGVSSAYVSAAVKEFTGKTFKELLSEKRLSKAASMLEKTELSVDSIIFSVGYENTSYFYRIFREKYGVTPSEYRKTAKVK